MRGAGLFIGVDIVDPVPRLPDAGAAHAIVNRLREHRVLISASGGHGHVLKIRPPLPFASEHATMLIDRLEATLRKIC